MNGRLSASRRLVYSPPKAAWSRPSRSNGTKHMLIHRDAQPTHDALPVLVKRLGASQHAEITRAPDTSAQALQCYWNVLERVSMVGGAVLYGWMVIEIPAVALLAWHHAIWAKSPTERVDISPHPITGIAKGTTLFVIDRKQDYDVSWPPGMPQVLHPLDSSVCVGRFIERHDTLSQLQCEYMCRQRSIPTATYCHRTGSVRTNPALPEYGRALLELERQYAPAIAAAAAARDECLSSLVEIQSVSLCMPGQYL